MAENSPKRNSSKERPVLMSANVQHSLMPAMNEGDMKNKNPIMNQNLATKRTKQRIIVMTGSTSGFGAFIGSIDRS